MLRRLSMTMRPGKKDVCGAEVRRDRCRGEGVPTAVASEPVPQPRLRFPSPLVELSVRINTIRLSFEILPPLARSCAPTPSGVPSRRSPTASRPESAQLCRTGPSASNLP